MECRLLPSIYVNRAINTCVCLAVSLLKSLSDGWLGIFACAEYALSAVTWLLFTVAFICELGRFVPHRTWLLRFPLLLIFAGEIAKFRCVRVACSPPWNAFLHVDLQHKQAAVLDILITQ